MFGQSPFSTTAFSEELSSGASGDARIYVTGFEATLEQGVVDFSLDGRHAVAGVDTTLEFGAYLLSTDNNLSVPTVGQIELGLGDETIELITPVKVVGNEATLTTTYSLSTDHNLSVPTVGQLELGLGNETIELITPVKVTGNEATLQYGVPRLRGDANTVVTGLSAVLSVTYSLSTNNNLAVTNDAIQAILGNETIELITPVKVVGNQATLTTAYSLSTDNNLSVTTGAVVAEFGNETIELITPVEVTGNESTLQFGINGFRLDCNWLVDSLGDLTVALGDVVPSTGSVLSVTTLGQLELGLGNKTIELITPVKVAQDALTVEFGDYTAQTNSYLSVASDPLTITLGAYEVELRQDIPAPGAQLDLTLNSVRIISDSGVLVANEELTMTLGDVIIPQTALVSVTALGTIQTQLGVYGVESITPVHVVGFEAATQFGTLGYFSENYLPVTNDAINVELGAYRTEMITPVVVTSLGTLNLEIASVNVAEGTGAPVTGLELDAQMGKALIYENAEVFAVGFSTTLEFGEQTVSIGAPVPVDTVGRIRTFLGEFDTYTETKVYLDSLGEIRMDIEPVTVQTQAIIHIDATGALQLHMGRELVWHQIAAPKKTRWRDVGIS